MANSSTEQDAQSRAMNLLAQIQCDGERKKILYEAALAELQKGLEMHRRHPSHWHPSESDFMMLDCCLEHLPRGDEEGIFYALDFGGTNVRVLRVTLPDHQVTQKNLEVASIGVSRDLPRGVMDARASATLLFDTIAMHVKSLMKESGDLSKDPKTIREIGFTFSFGITQPEIDVAILGQWSKGFQTGTKSEDSVIGRDVCKLLNKSFERQGVPAHISCVLNDTTGTLSAAAMEKDKRRPPCLVGMIVGTGLNACYYDPEAEEYGYKGRVINVEIGGFANASLPRCIADIVVDFNSSNRGNQLLEKMVSGLYLGELCRILLLYTLRDASPFKLWEEYCLSTESMAEIFNLDDPQNPHIFFEGIDELALKDFQSACGGDTQEDEDRDSDSFTSSPSTTATLPNKYSGSKTRSKVDPIQTIMTLMDQQLGWSGITSSEALIVKSIVDAVFIRSANMIACMVAALCKKTRRLQRAMGGVSVGVDGSLYCKNTRYQRAIEESLQEILGTNLCPLITFLQTSDGSGKGAACLAAALSARPSTNKQVV